MALVFRIDHERRLVVTAGYGTLTDDDVFGYERGMASRHDTIGYNGLIDMTHVTQFALPSTDRVQDLATQAAGKDVRHGATKLAIVAPGDLAFGLGRMFQTRREMDSRSQRSVGVFRTMAEALAFLQIDSAPTLPTPE